MSLTLNEAQMLWDAVNDPTFLSASQAFFREQKELLLGDLVRMIRQSDRNTLKEAQIAGRVEANETCLQYLRDFAERQYREVKA